MKDLIIICAYTPDNYRKNILNDFVKSIDKVTFDVMVSSHSDVFPETLDNIDYFIYEKNNEVLYDFEFKYLLEYHTDDWFIETTESRDFNHFIAAYRLFYLGITNAKKIGYKKVHVIEYDTIIKNMDFFNYCSELICENSIVYFETDYLPKIISYPMSFNLEKINKYWFEYNENEIFDFLKNNPWKTIEEYELIKLNKEINKIPLNYKKIKELGIILNTYFSGKEKNWYVPIINENNELCFFTHNSNLMSVNIKLIINDKQIKNYNIKSGYWNLDKIGKFDDISKLTIIIDNEHIKFYDFDKINSELFKIKNRIVKKIK